MNDLTKCFNLDCMEGMKEFPDKYFDLAIVDPPYGIWEDIAPGSYTRSKMKFHQLYSENSKTWDVKPSKEYFHELQRISKNQIICGGNYFSDSLPASRGWAIYDKVTDGMACINPELIYTSFQTACKIFRHRVNGGKIVRNIHPTQKPVALYKWLLKNYAKEGDKILDTHLGSQSSRIAAFDMGFDFTGYELDKDYFEAGNKRFAQHKAQLKLFA